MKPIIKQSTPYYVPDCTSSNINWKIYITKNGLVFASAWGKSEEEVKIVAKKLAAVDDLIEALQNLYNSIDSCVDLTPEVLRQAKEAIQKATA